MALEWFSSLPNNSINSFSKVFDAFLNNFQVNIAPKINITNLMQCKQEGGEKVLDLIRSYQLLISHINLTLLDVNIQRVFIENLKIEIREKISLM